MPLNLLIIEDEMLSALKLKNMLLKINDNFLILDILDSIEKSISFIDTNKSIDLIFLDIQLSDGTGIELLQKTKTKIPIIFTTAYNEFAIEAFKFTSVDYLLKPINYNELKNSIEKYDSIFHDKKQYHLIEIFQKNHLKIIGIKGKNKYPIQYSDIIYFYIENRIVWLVNIKNEKFYVNYKLEELENILPSFNFFRTNRQTIVSKQAIAKIERLQKSKIKIHFNSPPAYDIIVSSKNSSKFKLWFYN